MSANSLNDLLLGKKRKKTAREALEERRKRK